MYVASLQIPEWWLVTCSEISTLFRLAAGHYSRHWFVYSERERLGACSTPGAQPRVDCIAFGRLSLHVGGEFGPHAFNGAACLPNCARVRGPLGKPCTTSGMQGSSRPTAIVLTSCCSVCAWVAHYFRGAVSSTVVSLPWLGASMSGAPTELEYYTTTWGA